MCVRVKMWVCVCDRWPAVCVRVNMGVCVCVWIYGRNDGVSKRGRRSALFVLVTGVCGYTNTDGDGVLFYVRVIRRIYGRQRR